MCARSFQDLILITLQADWPHRRTLFCALMLFVASVFTHETSVAAKPSKLSNTAKASNASSGKKSKMKPAPVNATADDLSAEDIGTGDTEDFEIDRAADMLNSKSERWTWSRARQAIQSQNPDLKQSKDLLESEHANTLSKRGAFMPELKAQAAYDAKRTFRSADPTVEPGGSFDEGAPSAAIVLSQNLFSGGADASRYSSAKLSQTLAELDLKQKEISVLSDLKIGFSQCLYDESSVQLAKEILKRRRENLRDVQLRFASGRENRGSVMLSKAYLNSARVDMQSAGPKLELAYLQLRRLLGVEQDLKVSGNVPLSPPPTRIDLAKLTEQSAAVTRAKIALALAESDVKLARASFSPTLDLNSELGKVAANRAWEKSVDYWKVGAVLTIPLFNGGRDYYGYKSSIAKKSAADAALTVVRLETRKSLESAYLDYKSAFDQLQVAKDFMQAAVIRADIARGKYKAGLMTFEDWDSVENDLISKEQSLLSATNARAKSEAEWERLKGVEIVYDVAN